MKTNLLLCADGYKYTQPQQYDPEITGMFSYIEARANNFGENRGDTRIKGSVFFGLQAFIKEYLMTPITDADIDEAKAILTPYIGYFPEAGFRRIVKDFHGYFPVTIRAVPEGTIVPFGNILASIECYEPDLFWCASFLETAMLRSVWYPTTVATISKLCKNIIRASLEETSDNGEALMSTRLHDFGARGASSHETAMLGGMGHLVNFDGTDTVEALAGLVKYYGSKGDVGCSIPASEHSTMTSWGRENESKAYANMIERFGKPGGIFACVSDAYDIFNATEKLWGTELKDKVVESGAVLVIRPDSGDPISTCIKVAKLLDEKFGSTINSKGFKVLNNVRIIQGDGIDPDMIRSILFAFQINQFAGDNIAFGMGGALLQCCNRDSFSFAQKCSMVEIGGRSFRPVYKDPIGSKKVSKRGFLSLEKDFDKYTTVARFDGAMPSNDLLVRKYDMVEGKGPVAEEETIYEIRERSMI
jgi:nicotinamide phosphoribosyltransferase